MRAARLGLPLAALLLAACGQKGPLTLPDAGGEVVTRPAQTPEPAPPEQPVPEDEESAKKQPPER